MSPMGRFVRLGLVLAAAATLAACSSMSTGTATTATIAPAAAPTGFNQDIASAILVFDIPATLEPVPDASVLAIRMVSATDSRGIDARLVPADADEMMSALPPPAADRTYFLFGFSPADQAKLREAQAWEKTQPAGSINIRIDIAPEFCTTGQGDAGQSRYSIFAALPGSVVAPLTSNALIADLVESRQRPLPACAGHSG